MPEVRHPFLLRLALRLLTKAERNNGDARLKLDRREAPELYAQTDLEAVQGWVLLLEDWCRGGAVNLSLQPTREFAGFTDRNPRLELRDFASLADWAGYQPQAERWQARFLAHLESHWPAANRRELLDYLGRNPLAAVQGLPIATAAASLATLQDLCASGMVMALREASALAFQGRSKVLDNREELLRVLGAAAGQFQELPIQLLLDAPETVTEVLFVENLLTFEHMADHRLAPWRKSLLAYSAGFKGGARRLRTAQGCRVYMRGGERRLAEDWLFGRLDLPVCFFGDLDFSGMSILASLREGFPAASAWRHGYSFLAENLANGGGHTPEQAGKERQTPIASAGCAYADGTLLPLLRREGRCIDQELFQPWNVHAQGRSE